MSTRSRVGEATQLWLLWKRAHEAVRTTVVSHTTVPADVSEPELSVLAWLYQSEGRSRQSEIAKGLRWDRTRLSHLLTRMEKRGYIDRTKERSGVVVALATAGEEMIEAAAPGLEEIAQQRIVDRLGEADARKLGSLLTRLLDAEAKS